ncbi:hypothetical protein BST95_01945 [Halioglobus japonicus]|uniref:SCP domain-containing protein n=2 Tax=Halioglobus japonicus TaxID=930805 RepID=A0AAP8MC38_9GAMM|nr:hypothetical protein BST95_01945 [Halioglobus japonicus]PLW85073.1 hypothetical protein C0029_16210 [Halioglobus japonicus]
MTNTMQLHNMRKSLPRLVAYTSLALALGGCRLVIITDGKGHIESASHLHSCDQPSCSFEITEEMTDTFTAVAAEDYRFVRWQGICSRSVTPVCEATVSPLEEEIEGVEPEIKLWANFERKSKVRTWFRDADGDQFGSAADTMTSTERPLGYVVNDRDCDDTNPTVYPWRDELDDGIDNNCNDLIDEGLETVDPADLLYRDVDGDGYGVNTDTVSVDEPQDGYVSEPGDCDDNNDDIYPGAQEQYDSADNNCDGEIDEGFQEREFYRDVDNDGFGDADVTTFAVLRPVGYATIAGDNCPSVYNPAQADADGDGIGNSCDDFTDSDNDGVEDRYDNCMNASNPGQEDSDSDGAGDACDDTDNNQQPDPAPEPDPAPVDCERTALDQEMLDAVNAFRAQTQDCGSEGVFPPAGSLSWNCQLKTAAVGHSTDMAQNDFFSHTGSNGSSARNRIDATGYNWRAYGENLAAGRSDVNDAMQQWAESDGHCANMMTSRFTEFGSARATNANSRYRHYWTQVFGQPF